MTDHRVNLLEVELRVDDADLAAALIERTSRLHERRIAPLLDRIFSEHSGPDRLDRLDRLELDLGALRLPDLEDDLLRALEAALRAALRRALADRRGDSHSDAALELLATFAAAGCLPWWANTSRGDPIAAAIATLRREAPAALLALLRDRRDDPTALARLARHLDAAALDALIDLRWPTARVGLRAALQILTHQLDAAPQAGPRRRLRLRLAVLTALLDPTLAPAPALRVIVQELADLRGWRPTAPAPRPDLPPELHKELTAALAERDPAPERTEPTLSLERSAPTDPEPLQPVPTDDPRPLDLDPTQPDPRHDHRPPDLEQTAPASTNPQTHKPTEGDAARDLEPTALTPAAAQRRAITAASALDPTAPSPTNPQTHEEPSPRSRAEGPEPAARRPPDPPAPSPSLRPRLDPLAPRPAPPSRPPPRARLDELYVEDAGLVILWPFLGRFFQRVGLLDDQQRFHDEPAVMQAIALLAQLARGDPDPPEYTLPLAKLLVGRAPAASFTLARPLEAPQIDECERLLAAVIAHATILRDMPVAAFRAAFLRRPAALCTRDGAWTLQVEGRAHDLVLARFPWAWSWVKLPWMPDPLRVEWA
jgi:hypothetical protein